MRTRHYKYTQAIDLGPLYAVIMPTFGSLRPDLRKQHHIPLRVDRKYDFRKRKFRETPEEFKQRVEKLMASINSKIDQYYDVSGNNWGLWIKYVSPKKRRIHHHQVIES